MYGLPLLSAERMRKNHKHAVPGVRTIEDFKRFVPAFPDIHKSAGPSLVKSVSAALNKLYEKRRSRSSGLSRTKAEFPLLRQWVLRVL